MGEEKATMQLKKILILKHPSQHWFSLLSDGGHQAIILASVDKYLLYHMMLVWNECQVPDSI